MNGQTERTIVESMNLRTLGEWPKQRKTSKQQPYKRIAYMLAMVLCLSAGTYALVFQDGNKEQLASVMTSGFEYDETLGRLQYVSNILPESAMVFLSADNKSPSDILSPSDGNVLHGWSQSEPWIEYDQAGEIRSCGDGEVMMVIRNRENKYTVRLRHEGGYESVYSGLTEVDVAAYDSITVGERIGSAKETAAFELRRDGFDWAD